MKTLINKRKIFTLIMVIPFLTLFFYHNLNIVEAKTKHTLKDFGLTEENVKFLSQEEIDKILNGMTPEESRIYLEEKRKTSTSTSKINYLPGSPTVNSKVNIPPNDNIIDCFDYYHFGSVQTDIFSSSKSAIPGTEIQFSGKIINNNSYPVVDGTLYVKVFIKRSDVKEPNGPDVVDQFIVKDNISIKGNGSTPIDFKWYVPLNSKSGDYSVATYFITSKNYNLMGLSFTDDVIGNTFDFRVDGSKSIVYFDKKSVTINDKEYFFATFPPKSDQKQPVNIQAKINNDTDKEQKVDTVWKLYRWDSINPGNFIKEIKTSYTIKSKSSLPVKLSIPDKDYPVYYLVGELKYKDTKSIIGIRFVRDGIDRLRINFPSINKFPIKKGESVSLFSCLHNSGTSDIVNNGKLILKLIDSNKNIIDEYEYNGPVSGNMMGIKKDLVSKNNLNKISIYAELWQEGNLVEKTTINYDCNEIDPSSCIKNNNYNQILLSILFVILILIVIIYNKKKNLGKQTLSIFILLILSMMISFPHITEAKNTSWHQTYDGYLSYFWNWDDTYMFGSDWVQGLGPRDVTVTYDTEIVNLDTNSILYDTSEVPVNSNILLKFRPHKYTDIFWFGTGYADDSPFGQWRENSAPPKPPRHNILGTKLFHYTSDIFLLVDKNGIAGNSGLVDSNGVDLTGAKYKALFSGTPPVFDTNIWPANTNYAIADSSYAFLPSFPGPYCPNTEYDPSNPNTLQDIRDIASFTYTATQLAQVYISLVIAPPVKTITNTDGMDCGLLTGDEKNGYSMQCKINRTGSINPKFNFASTNGSYFYRYFWFDPSSVWWGCHGNNIAMTGPGSDVIVPEQTVSYQLTSTTVNPSNRPPAPPTITGPTSGNFDVVHTFNVRSTDPDNDQLKYGIDWNSDGTVDQWFPVAGLFDSGTSQDIVKTWLGDCTWLGCSGTQYFKALAVDSNGQSSTWSTYSINLSDPNLPDANMSCNLQASSLSINNGNSSILSWTSSNANSCFLSENNTVLSNSLNGTLSVSPNSSKSYTLTCNNPSSNPISCTSSINIDVTQQNLSNELPLWLNGDTNTSSITVRPGQSFGINWKTTGKIQNLVSGSCIGRTIDSNGNYISVGSWNNTDPENIVELPDDQDSSSLNTSIANKGEYKLKLSCNRNNNGDIETIPSNEVKVRVIQPIIQEK